jgi:hypothetical protein
MNGIPELHECTGFEWDQHNSRKIWAKHRVTPWECEQIFFNPPLIVLEDAKHSQQELRMYALGHTDLGRRLYVVFTLRGKLIRVITARDMSKKERKVYDSYEE